MIVAIYEALIGLALIGLVRGLWVLQGRSRLGLALSVGAVAAFVWPWAWHADWVQVARVALVAAIVGLFALGYARLLRKAREIARAREEDGEP